MALARFSGKGRIQAAWPGQRSGGFVYGNALHSLLSAVVTGFTAGGKTPSVAGGLSLFLVIPLNHLTFNLQGIDHGQGNFRWLNATRALLYPIFFIGIVFCWWLAADKVFWVAVALLMANGSVASLRLLAKMKNFRAVWQSAAVAPMSLLKESYPFVSASIIAILYMQMDKALLIWLLSPKEIGWYVAGSLLQGVSMCLTVHLALFNFPRPPRLLLAMASQLWAKSCDKEECLSLLAGVVLAILLPWWCLVYGPIYLAAAMGLLLLPGLILSGLGGIVNQALCGQGHPVAGIISKVFGLVVMALLGVNLVRDLGGQASPVVIWLVSW